MTEVRGEEVARGRERINKARSLLRVPAGSRTLERTGVSSIPILHGDPGAHAILQGARRRHHSPGTEKGFRGDPEVRPAPAQVQREKGGGGGGGGWNRGSEGQRSSRRAYSSPGRTGPCWRRRTPSAQPRE